MSSYFLIVIFLLSCFFFLRLYKNRKIYILSWKLQGPIALPVIGNSLTFFCKNEDILERAIVTVGAYSSPLRFWLGPKFLLVFNDPEQAGRILSSSNFAYKDQVYKYMKIPNGEGLISGSGPKWKRDRKLMGPLFLKKNMDEYFPIIHHHTQILLEKLETQIGSGNFDAGKYIHKCCADFVNESIIGIKTDAQSGKLDDFLEAVDRMYELVHARITKVWLQIEWFFKLTKYFERQEQDRKKIHNFMRNVIKINENKRSRGEQIPGTLLDKILEIRENNPNFALGDDLVHHLCTLYSASEDTATTIASFALLLLGMHPKIQARVFQEINTVIRDKSLEKSDLAKLAYLEMCIKEVLRLFPIAPFLMRTTLQDFPLDQIVIPKNCSVVVCIFNIHRSPKFWARPNEFYPEHFSPEEASNRHPSSYLPFSSGPRGCPGKPYAYMALKIMLAEIIRKYEIVCDEKFEDLKLKTDISVRPKSGAYPIKIKLRA